jgi:hypothetical protein
MTSCVCARASSRRGRRDREDAVHDAGGVGEVADGLEQRHDVHVQRVLQRAQQAGFLQQHRDFEEVGDAVGLGDDAVRIAAVP